ncbi:TRAP transporter large permease [Ferrovibrio sp.]|uniref:TRAP transporter large permease n=1 Tax=Ferrovibrio sp. TaxID=1917215 RepID=UPI001B72105D|nr:TRAP transporter large permease [Ferrovibrio sp.]MBP7065794.1 TRAP transporter large permease [Ferrovibrio sp.]
MTGFEIGALSIAVILFLILGGFHVATSLMLVSFAGVWILRDSFDVAANMLVLAVSDSISSYVFGVIPLFVLMGLLVAAADLGKDVYEVANQIFRRVSGGLGIATVAANAVFAAITGISIASASVFTRVAVPEMLRYGYGPRFSVGVVAGSSVLGMLIPPSLLFIVYGLLTDQSINDLFLAGIVPGLILAITYSIGILAMARFWPNFVGGPGSARAAALAAARPEPLVLLPLGTMLAKLLPVALLVLLVLGGIYGGIFTATEAGAIGAFGAMLVAIAKRKLDLATFWRLLMETGHITASICFLVLSASMYSRMLGVSGMPMALGEWAQQMSYSAFTVIALYIIVVLVLGCLIDSVSIMLLTVPLFLPLLAPYGMNLIWFGVITVMAVEIGLMTPPFGIACFVIKSVLHDQNISLEDVFIGALPFAGIMLLTLILLIVFPGLSLIFL